MFTVTLSGPSDTLDKFRQRVIAAGYPIPDEQSNHGFADEPGTSFLTVEDSESSAVHDIDELTTLAEPYGWVLRSHGLRAVRPSGPLLGIDALSPAERLTLAEQLLGSLKEA